MTRMGKVFLAVLVLLLTCFLVIGAGSSEVKAQPPHRVIKIKVNANTGQIIDFSLEAPNTGNPDIRKRRVPAPYPPFEFRGNIFYYSGSNCIVLVIGGFPYQVCW